MPKNSVIAYVPPKRKRLNSQIQKIIESTVRPKIRAISEEIRGHVMPHQIIIQCGSSSTRSPIERTLSFSLLKPTAEFPDPIMSYDNRIRGFLGNACVETATTEVAFDAIDKKSKTKIENKIRFRVSVAIHFYGEDLRKHIPRTILRDLADEIAEDYAYWLMGETNPSHDKYFYVPVSQE